LVGDANSDPELMQYLGAEKKRETGQFFTVWETPLLPREVLDLAELKGYSVEQTTGIGQTFAITLHKALDPTLLKPLDTTPKKSINPTLTPSV